MKPNIYSRVCGAIIRGRKILMVKYKKDRRTHWTLPGGGIRTNEQPEEAIVREVKEETGLMVDVSSLLYNIRIKGKERNVSEKCYLLIAKNRNAILGHDPEHSEDDQRLVDMKWIQIEKVQQDKQVSLVLSALGKGAQ